jgi:DNA repair protein RadC
MKAMQHGPRERAQEMVMGELADVELLALVLGTTELAASMLEEQGGLAGLARCGFGALAHSGVGSARAMRIVAAIELGRRVAAPADLPFMPDSRAVAKWGQARIGALEHEELWVLAVDGNQRVRAARRVAAGGLHGMLVSVRDPLRFALREGASTFLIVHNHPSGDPRPSIEDMRFTEQLGQAGDAVGTPLLDHVIIAQRKYCSMLDEGLIPGRGRAAV